MTYLLAQELSETLGNLITDHWAKVVFLLIGALLSLLWKYFLDRRAWKNRQGIETLHLSSNTIEYRKTETQPQAQSIAETKVPDSNDAQSATTKPENQPWLILDCVFEDDLNNKVSNRYVRQLIKRAITKTTVDQPFLRFGSSEDDHWFVMNMLRMGIAEIKGGDSLEKLATSPAVPIADVKSVFAVPYERWPGMRQGKIRIMLAREDDIADDKFSQDFQFEDPHHVDRPKTMRQMTADYNGPRKYTMELRLPVRGNA
jgi:hypothetical protein